MFPQCKRCKYSAMCLSHNPVEVFQLVFYSEAEKKGLWLVYQPTEIWAAHAGLRNSQIRQILGLVFDGVSKKLGCVASEASIVMNDNKYDKDKGVFFRINFPGVYSMVKP